MIEAFATTLVDQIDQHRRLGTLGHASPRGIGAQWWSICRCGWESRRWSTIAPAFREHAEHVVSEIKDYTR